MTSTIMTVRIDPNLLAALKKRARTEGRSVSAEVIRMIRREVDAERPRVPPRKRTAGMFSEFEAPELEELKELRRGFSRSIRKLPRRSGRAA